MNVGFSALHPTYSLFTIKPDTRLYLHISWSDWSKSPLGRESQPIIHRKLLEIEGLRGYIPERIHDRWPEIPLEVWAQNVEGIIRAIEESIEEMEGDVRPHLRKTNRNRPNGQNSRSGWTCLNKTEKIELKTDRQKLHRIT